MIQALYREFAPSYKLYVYSSFNLGSSLEAGTRKSYQRGSYSERPWYRHSNTVGETANRKQRYRVLVPSSWIAAPQRLFRWNSGYVVSHRLARRFIEGARLASGVSGPQ